MFCPECGTQNADDVIFCAGCGTRLAAEQQTQQPVYEAPVQPQQPVYQQPVYQIPTQPQQPVYQQPYQAYQQPYQTYQQHVEVPGKGMGIAGMVLGIVSLVMCCGWYLSAPCAVIGLILSIVAMCKAKKAGMNNGFALAGIICSSIGLALAVLSVLVFVGAYGEMMTEVDNYAQYY